MFLATADIKQATAKVFFATAFMKLPTAFINDEKISA